MKQFYKTKIFLIFLLISGLLDKPSVLGFQGNGNPCNNSNKYLYWVGDVDNDFFNELNWRETTQKPSTPNSLGQSGSNNGSEKPSCLPGANKEPYTICLNDHDHSKDKVPEVGSLLPGQAIDFNLYIASADIEISSELIFACEQKGITLSNTQMKLNSGFGQGVLSMDNESTVRTSSSELPSQVLIDFLDAGSWIYWDGITPDVFDSNLDPMIKIKGMEASLGYNFRINQYYQKGSVIRPRDETYSVLTIFSENDFSGQSAELKERIIYNGNEIPSGMDNAIRSFVLKRGYMATVAVKPNGTSKGKVYIASEEDMLVENLPVSLDGNVSFIRVVPWNWVTKKGTSGFFDRIDASWYYNWGLGLGSRPNYENAAMAWGAGGASLSSVNTIINRENITHFLG